MLMQNAYETLFRVYVCGLSGTNSPERSTNGPSKCRIQRFNSFGFIFSAVHFSDHIAPQAEGGNQLDEADCFGFRIFIFSIFLKITNN